MKQISKSTHFLPGFINGGLLLSLLFLFLMLPPALAYNPAVDDPKLEELDKNCKAITSQYRDALKLKKDFIRDEIKLKEDAIAAQDDKEKRKSLVVELRGLKNQHDELSDKIRAINAGEVVKLSNTKDKVIAFLTRQ